MATLIQNIGVLHPRRKKRKGNLENRFPLPPSPISFAMPDRHAGHVGILVG